MAARMVPRDVSGVVFLRSSMGDDCIARILAEEKKIDEIGHAA